MSFSLYVVGYVVLIAGLAWGAYMLKVPPTWIGIGAVILVGIGIITGVSSTRQKDPSSS